MLDCAWTDCLLLIYGFWLLKCCVHRRVPNHQPTEQQETAREIANPIPNRRETRDVNQVSHVDYVTTNANSSQGEFQLYVFEDNEAVFERIIKGRSPTVRHVSRTHRVALAWLFDRINLDPKIQIKYVGTKNHSGTCWPKVVLHVMNGIIFFDCWTSLISRCFSSSHFLSKRKQNFTSKRAQESTAKEGSAVAKPRPMSLVWRNLRARSKCFEQPGESRVGSEFCFMERQETGASQRPRPNSTQDWRQDTIFRYQETGAEWSQSNWKDKVVFPQYANLRPWIPAKSRWELAAKVESRRRGTSTQYENHCLDMGIVHVDNDESFCSSWTKLHWKLEVYRNTNFEELKNLFDLTQKLILEHEAEILNVSPIDWTAPFGARSTLTHDQLIK